MLWKNDDKTRPFLAQLGCAVASLFGWVPKPKRVPVEANPHLWLRS